MAGDRPDSNPPPYLLGPDRTAVDASASPAFPANKTLGAYYTAAAVASALSRWAIDRPDARVLDPSSGGGVFLQAAAERLLELGGDPGGVYGVELDAHAHRDTATRLGEQRRISAANLRRGDFFAVEAAELPPMTAVIGNPPFIRFQRFKGDARARALARAAAQGVTLGPLTSSWAPFVVHACSFLAPGGKLAMVVPEELGHAAYARPLLDFLTQRFHSCRLLGFERPLFPTLDQSTLVLLAVGYRPARAPGPASGNLWWRLLPDAEALGPALAQLEPDGRPKAGGNGVSAWRTVAVDELLAGRSTLQRYRLPEATADLYRRLEAHPCTYRLGSLARIETGYVTGANRFFHLSPAAAAELPPECLRPAVWRRSALTTLSFGRRDWRAAAAAGRAGFLLCVDHRANDDALPDAVQSYLHEGERLGLHRRYKTRARTPWFRVPRVQAPPLILTAMNGERVHLCVNRAKAVVPNTFHAVTPRGLEPKPTPQKANRDATAERTARPVPVPPWALAVAWLSSLTRLSCELEGHVLGGGMLKLEPSEAAAVLVADGSTLERGVVAELDRLLRRGELEQAQAQVDELLLRRALDLTADEVQQLAEGAALLAAARRRR